jgi:hypothetical protein
MRKSKRIQGAIDRLVKAVHQQKEPEGKDVDLAIKGWDEDVVGNTDLIAVGISLNNIENRLSDQDLSDHEGTSLDDTTNADRIAYARQLLVNQSSEYDSDVSPAFMGADIESSDGVGALLVFSVAGYSFSGVSVDCYGVFRSLDDFKGSARNDGYLLSCEISDVDDTRHWVSDQEILHAWNK